MRKRRGGGGAKGKRIRISRSKRKKGEYRPSKLIV